MDTELQRVLDKLEKISHQQAETQQIVEKMHEQLKKVTLKIENEIEKNISLIAEGHLDLNRQMKEVTDFNDRLSGLEDRMSPVEEFIQSM